MHEPHLNPCERDKAIQTPLPPSRLKDGEKQYGDLPTCSPGEVKGGGAGGGRRGRRAAVGLAGSCAVSLGESPWQVIRKNWHGLSGNYMRICAGVWLVGFKKLELLPQLNGLVPSFQSINGNQNKKVSFSRLV